MTPPNNNIIPQNCKMTDNTSAGVGVQDFEPRPQQQNFEPRPRLPQQQNLEPRLPEDWKVVRLGDVADISSGGSAPQGDKYFKGDKPFVRVSHIDNQNYSINKYDLINDNAINDYRLKLFPKGTIVFPKSGATVYLEKRAMLPIDAYVVSHLCTVISNKEKAIQHFLFYVLINLKLAKEKADGYPTLNISEVKQIPIPLPPLPEQQKIAAVLSAVQEAKEKTEAVIATAKALKKSMMKHLYTYGPVSPQEAETVSLKETEIGPVPEDWEVARLGEYCNVFSGYAFKSDDFCNNGILVVKIGNLQNGSIVFNAKESFFPREKINDDMSKFILNEGDILIALTGATTGKISLVPKSVNGALLNQRVGKFSFYNDSLYKSFVMYYFITDEFQNHIKINIMQSAQGNISPKQIETFPIPLPPLPEQQKIASILSAIDEKIEAEENKKKALEELFKTLLHNLMTAKIRVNQLEVTS